MSEIPAKRVLKNVGQMKLDLDYALWYGKTCQERLTIFPGKGIPKTWYKSIASQETSYLHHRYQMLIRSGSPRRDSNPVRVTP